MTAPDGERRAEDGLLDTPLYYLNNAVWDLLSLGTGYIDRIAYSVYYAAAGTVV